MVNKMGETSGGVFTQLVGQGAWNSTSFSFQATKHLHVDVFLGVFLEDFLEANE